MADASQVLGSPEVAGTFLSPKGMTKKMTTATAGRMVGGVVGAVGANVARSREKSEGAPSFGQISYLAVTADEVALVRAKVGAFKPKIGDEILDRKPRSEVELVKTTERVVQELSPG